MKKFKLYDSIRKVKALVLAGTLGISVIGFSGCTKQNNESDIVYTVKDANKDNSNKYIDYSGALDTYTTSNNDAVYENYVDIRNLNNNAVSYITTNDMFNMSDEDLEKTNYKIDYVYPVRELNLTSNIEVGTKYSSMTRATFMCDHNIVIPDCYKWASSRFSNDFNDNVSDIWYSYQELKGINGNYYLNYDFDMRFNKDIILSGNVLNSEYGVQESIKNGDELHYNALYVLDNNNNLVLIADEQTGMGSNCDNVKKTVMYNYNDIYKKISELDNKETKTFTDMDEFKDYIFNENINKVKNLKK